MKLTPEMLVPGQVIKFDTKLCIFEGFEGPFVRYSYTRELGYKGPGICQTSLAYLDSVSLPTSLEMELV